MLRSWKHTKTLYSHLCKHFLRSSSSDTIFALSSGQGRCGVAVIRISGPDSQQALKLLTLLPKAPAPRTALLRTIRDPLSNEVLDKGLVLWFPGPRSFTGEDSFELHVHGGRAVVNAVLNALGSVPSLRVAEPGEFTKRAFYNGKLDLTEVEGLGDLLQAETEVQRRQAFLQTQGSLSKLYNRWKVALTKCVARIEAHIDFDETDSLDKTLIETITADVRYLSEEIEAHLTDGRRGEILRTGVKTIIVGEPNVGKSSLMNLLCKRPAAIVTPIEGTTRDILEVTLNINGYPLVLADTAGLRSETKDLIEQEGISRALDLYKKSDLILLVVDAQQYSKWTRDNPSKSFGDYLEYYTKNLNIDDLSKRECTVIINKIDLQGELTVDGAIKLSCKSETGINDLLNTLGEKLKHLCGEPTQEHPSMNQARHRQHLSDCLRFLNRFLQESDKSDLVFLAEYLRKSLRHLGKLVGNVTSDDILDVIFKEFCIGK